MNHIRSQDFESDREKRAVLNDGLRQTLMQLDHDNRMNGIISLLADLDGAREDFETALWAAYAFNNLDTYESYLEAENGSRESNAKVSIAASGITAIRWRSPIRANTTKP